jgi:hypothetical protein
VLLLVASGLSYEEARGRLGCLPGRCRRGWSGRAGGSARRSAGRTPPAQEGLTGMTEMEQLEDMCRAVPPPDPQRLAGTRARVLTAIAERPRPARRGTPGSAWLAISPKHGRRWPGWVAPLAAAAAVTAVIAGTLAVSRALGGHGASPPASRTHGMLTDVSCSSPSSCVAVGQYY